MEYQLKLVEIKDGKEVDAVRVETSDERLEELSRLTPKQWRDAWEKFNHNVNAKKGK